MIRSGPVRLAVILLALATLAAPRAAYAGKKEEARASQLFDKAETEYQAGHFQAAIDLLLEAQRLAPDAVLDYNLARAYEGMGDLDHALESYRAYLAADPKSKDRGAVEARIKSLEDLRAARNAPPPPTQPTPQPTRPVDPTPPPKPSPAPWIVAGIGALGLGVGGVLGGLSLSKSSEAKDPKTSGVDATDAHDQAKTFATAANGTFIGSSVVLAAGVIWGVVDVVTVSKKKESTVKVEVSPGAIWFRGTF